ncbi:magnesium/cobalt transporter CorA [Candidatus Obscuribacterales bacterium]|nr:magnesium/cobalt transporter CorA [Candidatus Obscuribacterales bacterium]
MTRSRRRRAITTPKIIPGTSPGTLVADPKRGQPVVSLIAYSETKVTEEASIELEKIKPFLKKNNVVWVNVEGLGDAETIRQIGDMFGIHQLALEDVMTGHQRAKLEQYGDNYFLIAHMLELREFLLTEQICTYIGHGFIVTFQDGPLDCFEKVRERIRKKAGRIRSNGADYLAYALLDSIIDCYFPVLEKYGERLEDIEDEIIERCDRSTISKVHEVKRDLLTMRRAIWPLREAISSLLRDPSKLFAPETLIFMRDCADHTVQISDFIETFRELGADLMDVYLSNVSNRLGENMKLLTIITTICAPPTVVAAIYGMNFNPDVSKWNMPELNWEFGYPFALSLMVVLTILTSFILWSQGWRVNSENARRPPH